MEKLSDKLYNWASEIDEVTKNQAFVTSKLPILAGHLALMPDAHLGKGATIGSVIPTKGAIIPNAVGVDIGCGMIARQLNLTSNDLPDDTGPILDAIMGAVPAGLGKWHADTSDAALAWYKTHENDALTSDQVDRALVQFGTLGSGNHFFEVCLDQNDEVWIIMHSGSRGVGNQLAQTHVKVAKALAAEYMPKDFVSLDPQVAKELAWLQEGTPEFDAYIRDMQWGQDYAMANRTAMMEAATAAVLKSIYLAYTPGMIAQTINCHHNFAQKERHDGEDIWVTRKGAIKADVGDLGLIPGSMGGKSYVVSGLGSTDSYTSCSHGAGRRMSRTRAKKEFSLESFHEVMGNTTWQKGFDQALLDEHPGSYKNIDVVMADQKDLVKIEWELQAIVNYKGTS